MEIKNLHEVAVSGLVLFGDPQSPRDLERFEHTLREPFTALREPFTALREPFTAFNGVCQETDVRGGNEHFQRLLTPKLSAPNYRVEEGLSSENASVLSVQFVVAYHSSEVGDRKGLRRALRRHYQFNRSDQTRGSLTSL